ncbi:MAG: ParB/RepB/Spo0J family partition protein [Planctomycetaceae bacterium]|nr:ParB/RepB/Spo0J family partition protein [Planctomycetaceae bacterium]MBV8557426.1 ParB/RepB/Spo0J family partition protein [Planctomycetaceae bacterium]
MSKLDELMKHQENMDASLGVGYATGNTPPGMSLDHAQRVPARLQGVAKSKNAIEVPVDKIQPDPDQPREEFEAEALERLAESLKAKGQLQPIRVRWDEGRGVYVIIMGERRWRAAVMARLPVMTCVVHERALDPGEQLALQLVENALREDLRPVEQAKAYRKLMDMHNWSGNRLAKELAIDQAAVSRALALLDLPAAVQAKVDSGELATRTAYEIGKLDDAAEQLALAERAAAREISRDQVQATVKARKIGKPASAATPSPRREIRFDDGAKIVVTLPPGASGTEAIIEMLRRGIKKLQAELKAVTQSGSEGKGEAA